MCPPLATVRFSGQVVGSARRQQRTRLLFSGPTTRCLAPKKERQLPQYRGLLGAFFLSGWQARVERRSARDDVPKRRAATSLVPRGTCCNGRNSSARSSEPGIWLDILPTEVTCGMTFIEESARDSPSKALYGPPFYLYGRLGRSGGADKPRGSPYRESVWGRPSQVLAPLQSRVAL